MYFNVESRTLLYATMQLTPGYCGYEFKPDEPARWE
jgi:hypothetical protein